MKKLLLILLCLPMIGFGQNVNIPDAIFKAYLVGDTAINTNGDSEIQVSEANSFNGSIYCENMNIADLTGIADFTALTELGCWGNQLTSLDVTQNTALTYLRCYENQLTSLDVSANTALNVLKIGANQLTTLDLSQNTDLIIFSCDNNQLTNLDVRNGNNNLLDTNFSCTGNPNLSCINVDDSTWATSNWTVIDPQHYFSNHCSGTTSIKEHTTNKQLLKVTDLLVRETKHTNQPHFYIYDDGTVEKRIVLE